MIELLRRVAEVDPSRVALVTHEHSLGYGEMVGLADRAAAAMVEAGVSRVAVADHEAATALPVLLGASAVGVEATLYPPDPPETIGSLRDRFDHDVVVSPRDDLPEVVHPQEWLEHPRADVPAEPARPRPHLVLTTGTTGTPRGVRHDWDRLLRGVARVRPAPEERWLLAYGLHQFAGLQVLLHVFAAEATLVAPAPRRPREGLAAMRDLAVTHASATPTYWRFLLAELRSDAGPVPDLRQITLGGEAVPAPLLPELRRTFPDARISQVYAASEFGSTGSTRDERAGLPAEVLHRGEDADVAFRVVEGELWIRSRTGMLGYYGDPEVEDPDGWRPTGDLVEVVDDRILFQGRSSEIINVGGVKVHPLPIEERVGAVPGVDVARVYGRPNPMTGAIVALEVVLAADGDRDRVGAEIRSACADLPAAARPRSIRFVDQIATTGGKILRREP